MSVLSTIAGQLQASFSRARGIGRKPLLAPLAPSPGSNHYDIPRASMLGQFDGIAPPTLKLQRLASVAARSLAVPEY